jgi:hypothetical protein
MRQRQLHVPIEHRLVDDPDDPSAGEQSRRRRIDRSPIVASRRDGDRVGKMELDPGTFVVVRRTTLEPVEEGGLETRRADSLWTYRWTARLKGRLTEGTAIEPERCAERVARAFRSWPLPL